MGNYCRKRTDSVVGISQSPVLRLLPAVVQFRKESQIQIATEVQKCLLDNLYLNPIYACRNGMLSEAYLGYTLWKSHKPVLAKFSLGYH